MHENLLQLYNATMRIGKMVCEDNEQIAQQDKDIIVDIINTLLSVVNKGE